MATPESFRDRFDRRRLSAVALITYVIALLAWVAIVGRWLPMPGGAMGMRMSDPGVTEAMALSNGMAGAGLYLLMWGVMMVAIPELTQLETGHIVLRAGKLRAE